MKSQILLIISIFSWRFFLLIEKLSEIAKPEKMFYSLIFFFSSTEILSKRRKICSLMTEREAECTKSVSIYFCAS